MLSEGGKIDIFTKDGNRYGVRDQLNHGQPTTDYFPAGSKGETVKNPPVQLMSNIDYINDREIFTPFWQRARECMERVSFTPALEVLHCDSSNLGTQIFHDLIRNIAAFNGTGDFAVVVLNPDPFNYFNLHFGKYPGFIVEAQHTNDDFFEILMRDPGDSPADAIGFYSEQYAVLPILGEWFFYADRGRDGGTGVLGGPPDVMQFAQQRFGFYENPV